MNPTRTSEILVGAFRYSLATDNKQGALSEGRAAFECTISILMNATGTGRHYIIKGYDNLT
jgi:hypothetical protein